MATYSANQIRSITKYVPPFHCHNDRVLVLNNFPQLLFITRRYVTEYYTFQKQLKFVQRENIKTTKST
jgi:hypothetical protein